MHCGDKDQENSDGTSGVGYASHDIQYHLRERAGQLHVVGKAGALNQGEAGAVRPLYWKEQTVESATTGASSRQRSKSKPEHYYFTSQTKPIFASQTPCKTLRRIWNSILTFACSRRGQKVIRDWSSATASHPADQTNRCSLDQTRPLLTSLSITASRVLGFLMLGRPAVYSHASGCPGSTILNPPRSAQQGITVSITNISAFDLSLQLRVCLSTTSKYVTSIKTLGASKA